MAYDFWVAYDIRIGRFCDGTVAYSAMSIEIDLVWWELACDEQLCLMRSSFISLWVVIFDTIMEHLEYSLAHDSRGLTWLYQMDIDI